MSYTINASKQMRQFLQRCESVGCQILPRNNNHLAILTPSGDKVWCSSSPSDWRAYKRIESDLRKFGVTL